MQHTELKVGELARRTGLSVRALHHYDEIGLLKPSAHTASGHRLYTAADIARLSHILSLKQLGFSLEEIAGTLGRADFSALRVVELRLQRAREQLAEQRQLCDRLDAIARQLRAAEPVSADAFLQTIEAMTMFEKYYTPEQLKELEARRQRMGDDAIQEVEAEWPRLIARMREEMERGTDPASETVQALATRWRELVRAFTGGNPGIAKSLETMHQQEPQLAERQGRDPKLMEYVGRAMACLDAPG
ncbi:MULTISPECIES: MerR family transcriptional regulator [Corallococcus]|uniref:MerR family transcriptional regulator n=1 Tax=Corallococcus TaxID=83461 RepID=UPI00117F1296|nr:MULTISPECIES: MerR family transcriptional regulator [Corallococcus]NBD12666.1 MerR family transcriptional regulator [Corallococcus silvisoli]TSC28359.1 MerR family transcriptional regulator [Corallococcus sp. Z5C101001]